MRAVQILSVCAVCLSVTPACGQDAASRDRDDLGDHPYALLRDSTWQLQEALDPPDDSEASIERPVLDWYAEYAKTTQSGSQMVRLSGHRATFDVARSELEDIGLVLDEVDVEDWTAVGGTTAETGSRPTAVLLDKGGSSLMLLSYELELDVLARLAGVIVPVDQEGWIDAGGVVR
ncbi:MAG: hypothetical protein ACT4PX_11570 [Actinomycetota bacterium]